MRTDEAGLAAGAQVSARILAVCSALVVTACAGGEFGRTMDVDPDASTVTGESVDEADTGTTAGSSTEDADGPVEASSDATGAGGGDSDASSSASGDVPDTGQTTDAPAIPEPTVTSEPGGGSDNGDGDASGASGSVSTGSE